MNIIENCSKCLKPQRFCLCSMIEAEETKLEILILQHPQEPDQELGTARIAHLALKNSQLKIGLSWPNIKKALGKDAVSSEWLVFYLGSGVKGSAPSKEISRKKDLIQFVSKKGEITSKPKTIKGIVLLDGTWSQAKALWWRNPWLLKLNRAILFPEHPSLYRELRKEPRKECLSTLETIAHALTALGEDKKIEEMLKNLFKTLLAKKRT